MADITVQQISLDGLEASAGEAVEASDTVLNNGKTFIEVEDTGAGGTTVTVTSQVDCNQGVQHDVEVTVDAGEIRQIGPFPSSRFNNSAGEIEVACSPTANITIRAFSL